MTRTIDSVIAALPNERLPRLAAPPYAGTNSVGLGLAVESMKRHTPSDEGWQIFAGLQHAGYHLAGHRLPIDETDVQRILSPGFRADCSSCGTPVSRTPDDLGVVVMQDKREWDFPPTDFRDPEARFHNVASLAERPDLFKITILKDSHQRPAYHRDSAAEIGCHAWIVYYAPRIVSHNATYVRPEHLIRTYHSLNADLVPPYGTTDRNGSLLSGAVSTVYPLRMRLVKRARLIRGLTYLPHPGYSVRGTYTPDFLQLLSTYKISICTSSIYGYALRKIAESTACGCIVLTDLPADEVMPEIDGNLVRIESTATVQEVAELLPRLEASYDPERQRYFSELALSRYDYRAVGSRLAADIEAMRAAWNHQPAS